MRSGNRNKKFFHTQTSVVAHSNFLISFVGYLQADVDGSCLYPLNLIGSGGVLHNHNSQWLLGFSSFAGTRDAEKAKLMAILNGLRFAQNCGFVIFVVRWIILASMIFWSLGFVLLSINKHLDLVGMIMSVLTEIGLLSLSDVSIEKLIGQLIFLLILGQFNPSLCMFRCSFSSSKYSSVSFFCYFFNE